MQLDYKFLVIGGNRMNFLESILVAVFCMLFVFTVLVVLFFFIKAFSWGVKKIEAVATANAAPH